MNTYQKIPALFKRDELNPKLITHSFCDPVVEYLSDCRWIFKEKVDGTNIRIIWDGYNISFGGRTDKAEIPTNLLSYLESNYKIDAFEEALEQLFGSKTVILFGEGYGGKIQKDGKKSRYREDESFIMFDVLINDVYLDYDSVLEIGKRLCIQCVPVLLHSNIKHAVDFVSKRPCSSLGCLDTTMEGLVGVPDVSLCKKNGERVIIKIKNSSLPTEAVENEYRTN